MSSIIPSLFFFSSFVCTFNHFCQTTLLPARRVVFFSVFGKFFSSSFVSQNRYFFLPNLPCRRHFLFPCGKSRLGLKVGNWGKDFGATFGESCC
ncbi:hypothetical protein B9Z19DRAFT_765430 [Tuber borchii]|uniref:Secreted protein n=1 Tax=Tuber borchii TaxID=42251 RepID=A0A2T6ZX51_TUBBO|nr:hypothetical protein B9Z19DRAFT_765430 [Tuber borchii]